jgi:hypothetical protein
VLAIYRAQHTVAIRWALAYMLICDIAAKLRAFLAGRSVCFCNVLLHRIDYCLRNL